MADSTLYERSHEKRTNEGFGIAFGRITNVFPEKRLCEVKTFFGTGSMEDQHIPTCQWINMDANPEGDESSNIPRRGSTGLVFWIDNEPFIFGYFRALTQDGRAIPDDSKVPEGTEGDKIVSTVGGNKIRVRSNGVIEVESSKTLKTVYFPVGGILSHLCQSYQLRCDGGEQIWENLNALNETLYTAEFRRDILRTVIIVEEKGKVDSTIVRRISIGPGIPALKGVKLPVFETTTDVTGKTTLKVQPPGVPVGFRAEIEPTGGFNIKAGAAPQWEIDVSGVTGAMEIKNLFAKVLMSKTGKIDIESPGASVTISPLGEIQINSKLKCIIDAKQGVDINTFGPVNINAIGPVTVSGSSLKLDGAGGKGAAATGGVLVFPFAISPFTGTPIVQASNTVKASP